MAKIINGNPAPVDAALPLAPPTAESLLLEGRRNHFDFLRFVFAVWVVYSHCFILVENGSRYFDISNFTRGQTYLGHIAVQGFFIISGFLITMSWFRSRGVLDFLRRRALRIYPGYLAAFLFCALLVGPLGSESARHYFAQVAPASLLKQMATLDRLTVPPTFMNRPTPGQVNGTLWSIRMEFECYLLLPLLGTLGFLRRRGIILALAALLFAFNGVLETPLIHFSGRAMPETVVSHTGLTLYFLMGMTFYSVSRKILGGPNPGSDFARRADRGGGLRRLQYPAARLWNLPPLCGGVPSGPAPAPVQRAGGFVLRNLSLRLACPAHHHPDSRPGYFPLSAVCAGVSGGVPACGGQLAANRKTLPEPETKNRRRK